MHNYDSNRSYGEVTARLSSTKYVGIIYIMVIPHITVSTRWRVSTRFKFKHLVALVFLNINSVITHRNPVLLFKGRPEEGLGELGY